MPLALEYTQRAVQQEEEASGKVKLSELKDQDLFHTTSLAAYWDSIGSVYFRMGKLEGAEKYLKSAWVLSQSSDMAFIWGEFDGGAEMSNDRTFQIAGLKNGNGSAEFFLLFGSGGKVDEVKLVSGSEELKDAGKTLLQENFKVLLPDSRPERLLHRGVLLCDPTTHCTFVLYPPGSVRSVN